jgi:outer membrane protein OmpA-like peptidoglycan-associated protein
MKTRSILTMAAVGGIFFASTATGALAQNLNDNRVVRDARGNPVHSILSGTCVRTQWETKNNINPCLERGKVVYRVSAARTLQTEDTTITFAFDSARINSDARRKLDKIARVLKKSNDVVDVDVVGFADRLGDADYNVKLSKERAVAVKNYLAQKGYVNTRVVDTRGLGETGSITSCDSNEARSAKIKCLRPDRRVEVEIKFSDNS